MISEFLPSTDGDWKHIENFHDKLGQIANYTYRLSEEMGLKIVFSGKARGMLVNAEKFLQKLFEKIQIQNFKI